MDYGMTNELFLDTLAKRLKTENSKDLASALGVSHNTMNN